MNIRKLKKSEVLLIVIAILMCGSVIARAFHIKKVAIVRDDGCRPELIMAKGDIFHKEFELSYSHLVCNLTDVELDHSKANYITIDEYENAFNHYGYRVCNDTLYLEKNYQCEPNVVTDESLNGVLIKVGSQSLKSITVGHRSSITPHIKAIGAHASGKPAYKKSDLEKHTLSFDTLTLSLARQSEFIFFGNGEKISLNEYFPKNIKNSNRSFRSQKYFDGSVNNLTIDSITGNLNIKAQSMDIKKLTVNQSKIRNAQSSGSISANVSDTLEAYLYGNFDVLFTGQPHIIKEETNFGRVLNVNYIVHEKLKEERKRQELTLKQVDKNR